MLVVLYHGDDGLSLSFAEMVSYYLSSVVPSLNRSSQGGFNQVIVSNPHLASVFSYLIKVYGVYDHAGQPLGFLHAVSHLSPVHEEHSCIALLPADRLAWLAQRLGREV